VLYALLFTLAGDLQLPARLDVDRQFTVAISANATSGRNAGFLFAGLRVIFDVLAPFLMLTSRHPV
jgi:hypothetical protein